MKQPLRKDLEPVATSFIVKELVESHFDPNWHFHPHYQLFLVEEGSGTRFIGDSIKPFGPGDLVFLGPNLPHLWRSDQDYFQKQSGLATRGIVVYFAEDFLGTDFFKNQEMSLLRQLLNQARQGLEWTGPTRARAEAALQSMTRQSVGFERVISLLILLNDLSHAMDYQRITSPGYTNTVKPTETDRMQLVHDYVLGHFPDDLSLETVADLAGMTPPAFCRYFKARANKTFSEFVSEVRIGHACKLLIGGKLSVTQISFESGFRTLSNFNRQFKDITGQTPSAYVKTYRHI
ncbi:MULTISPECIES: AraC family transcriptional regulator [Spirosoma]|uniref:AraC family transcriptional regulator n=1 Tax=Spirosoma liriopis TaxID=2937440 RepID=A0ABT0HMG6_9BACT|nr:MULTISPECIES: AraC family transcriptional regulator [Spirosoma]MCK8493365.1 AraC family transcriptional regulator [Spirosoma liriopis]UHG92752.1 AraC family transcriptional regulator [Spirosoma oryzicola]